MAYRNHHNAASRPSIYQTVTDRIISNLKAGVIPWEKPWKTPRYAGGPFPRNFYTGKPYRGINVLLLWSSEYNSPFWLTFKQAQALKGNIRKGEHGTQIIFYKQLPEHAEKDAESTSEDERVPFVLCHYTVFNLEQCDGLTLPEISQPAYLAEGAVEYGNIMLDAEPHICVLIEGAFPRRFFIRGFKRNRLIAVGLRHLHAAIPHAMLHIAAPEDDEARLQLLFFGDKRHVRLPVLCRFRADFSRKSLNPRSCAELVQIISENHLVCLLLFTLYLSS
jgi:hypothetical protein